MSLTFEGATLPNNSIVNAEDINSKYGFINAIVCVTSETGCCNNDQNSWYLPGGTAVTSNSSFTQNKIYRQQIVLFRNKGYKPNGIFQCEIKGPANITQNLYVGIYLQGLGKCLNFVAIYIH